MTAILRSMSLSVIAFALSPVWQFSRGQDNPTYGVGRLDRFNLKGTTQFFQTDSSSSSD